MATDKDIDNLLEKWFETKKEITKLEKKCETYKRFAEQIMNGKGTDKISNEDYKLSRRTLSRHAINRKDVPKEIWNQYSKEISYPAFYLTQRK